MLVYQRVIWWSLSMSTLTQKKIHEISIGLDTPALPSHQALFSWPSNSCPSGKVSLMDSSFQPEPRSFKQKNSMMSIEHLSICILNLWYNWYNNNWSVLILFLPEIESWTQQTSLRMRTVWCSGRLPEGKQRPMLQWQAEGQNSWLQIRMLFQIGPCRPCIDLHRFLHWFGSFQKLITRISIHNYSHPQLVTTSVLSQVSTAIFQVAPWNASLDSVDMLDLWTHQWASLDQWAKRRSSGCQKSATKNFAAGKMEVFVAKNPLANHLNMSKNILGMDGNGSLPSLIAPQGKPLDTAWRCMEQNKRKTWRIPNTNLYKKHNAQKHNAVGALTTFQLRILRPCEAILDPQSPKTAP